MANMDEVHEIRFVLNMRRIKGLIDVARAGANIDDSVRADLNRAVVVFLHAAFEDWLRTIARRRLRGAPSDVLDKIPLVGLDTRPEKFRLGALAFHRSKSVEQLLNESVDAYFDKRSFSSVEDVENTLKQLGLDTTPFKSLYPLLAQMMDKRHRIVHEADLPNPNAETTQKWGLGDDLLLILWNLAVLNFHSLMNLTLEPTELHRWSHERRSNALRLAREAGSSLLAFAKDAGLYLHHLGIDTSTPAKLSTSRLNEAVQKLNEIQSLLGPLSEEEMFALWERCGPSPEENVQEVRAKIQAFVLNQNLSA